MMEQSPVSFAKGHYVGDKAKEIAFGSVIVSETIFEAGTSSDWHFHENPHFSHILDGGSTEIRENDSQFQTAGAGLYYYPGIPHKNVSYRPGTRILNVELDRSFFSRHQLEIPNEAVMFDTNELFNTGGLMRVLKEFKLNDSLTPIAIDQACVELIGAYQIPAHPGKAWMNKIKNLLNDRWNKPVTLVELATLMEVHPVTLSRLFSVTFHCTFGEYLRRLKMERSFALIKKSKYSLTEIAYQCGFFDQAHFTRTFLNSTGMLPKDYRKI